MVGPARYLNRAIEELAYARSKMAFVSGPRQVGKTTLARGLLKARGTGRYITWDDVQMRRTWTKEPSALLRAEPQRAGRVRSRPLFIFDEVHKAKGWKNTIKGLYDVHHDANDFFVTGSSRLNVYRRGSDSLMGRYLHFRLHPFSLRECLGREPPNPNQFLESLEHVAAPRREEQECLELLLRFGGFPEPFAAANDRVSNLWRRGRLEKVIHEDLRDLSRIPELSRLDMLASLLPERVGSLLSVQSLREDLEVAHDTVRRWLNLLDELYYIYEIKPFAKSIPRSLRKEGKLYLWDWSAIIDDGPRFENMVAGHLAKACAYWTDTGEGLFELAFLRDKEKREVDFLVVRDRKPWCAVEAKWSDTTPTKAFSAFRKHLGNIPWLQVVKPSVGSIAKEGCTVASAASVLRELP